tara:strand:+ start:697 stop:1662 length:966 start_codon:yes stop_codon:yes gene_type:complete
MNIKYVIIVLGEPFSTFTEIIGKYFKKVKILKKKIVLVGSYNLIVNQLKFLGYSIKLNKIHDIDEAKSKIVNIVDIDFKFKKTFSKISPNSNDYIHKCFRESLKLLKENKDKSVLINGPVSKKSFLKKEYLGITEYLSKKTRSKDEIMLIYNEKLSVSPLTTHIPLKYVSKKITKKKIILCVKKIVQFYKKNIKRKIKIAVLGLNPHCETIDKYSEEEKIIIPAIKLLIKDGYSVEGPFSADTFFLNKNISKYDVVIGMYHDQVLTPIKTLFKFNAINLTIGLPFIRISPDHGPNTNMIGKNKSDPSSFFYAMKFIENLKK